MRKLKNSELALIQQIPQVLATKYIFTEDVARVIQLALVTGRNALMYGLGGNGKSEMVEMALSWVSETAKKDVYIKSFSSDTQPAELYGGPDLQKLNDENKLEFATQFSFLNSKYFIAEEFGDAPGTTITSLKDTLSSKKFRNGEQVVDMLTEVVFGLTNVNPRDIEEKGDAYEALTQRFPLRLNVVWKAYDKIAFTTLFAKFAQNGTAKFPEKATCYNPDFFVSIPAINGETNILAEMLAKANADGIYISPRIARFAMEVCLASAILRGSEKVGMEDLVSLRFVMGTEALGEGIAKELEAAQKRAEADTKLVEAGTILNTLRQEFNEGKTVIKMLQIAKRATAQIDFFSSFTCPDSLVEKRDGLKQEFVNLSAKAQAEALAKTNV